MKTTLVRLDGRLVKQARKAVAGGEWTLATQIEFWVRMGRVAEAILSHRGLGALLKIERRGQKAAGNRRRKRRIGGAS